MATEQEKQEIKAALDAWTAAMSAADGPKLKSMWDTTYPNVVYIAEENEKALVGWAGINEYYDGLASGLENASWKYDNLVVDVFGDTAYAQCTALGQSGTSTRMEYVMRDTFIFRKTGGQWKIIHYHESANPTIGPDGHTI